MQYSQITTFPGTLQKLTPFSFLPILQGKKKKEKKIYSLSLLHEHCISSPSLTVRWQAKSARMLIIHNCWWQPASQIWREKSKMRWDSTTLFKGLRERPIKIILLMHKHRRKELAVSLFQCHAVKRPDSQELFQLMENIHLLKAHTYIYIISIKWICK